MSLPVNISAVKNPLLPIEGVNTYPVIHTGATALEYIRSVTGDLTADEIVLSVNGALIDPYYIPNEGDNIVFCPVLYGGGGNAGQKQVLRIVAMMAVMVAAVYTGGAAAALYGPLMGSLASAAVSAVGGILVNALIPIPIEEMKLSPIGALDNSKNYGWTSGTNETREGTPLPSLIGTRRFAPPLIGAYRYTDNERQLQYFRGLYALCDDIIEDIDPTDIFIKDQAISSYPSSSYIFSIGDDGETEAPKWFEDSVVEVTHNQQISEQTEVHNTTVSYVNFVDGTYQPSTPYSIPESVEVFTVNCHFPDGMHHRVLRTVTKSKRHEDRPRYVRQAYYGFNLHVRYRTSAASAWVEKIVNPIPPKSYNKPFSQAFVIDGVTSSPYEIQFTTSNREGLRVEVNRITAQTSLTGVGFITTNSASIQKIGVGLILPQGLYKVDDNGGFSNHTVKVLINVRKTGTTDWTDSRYVEFTDKTSSQIRRYVEFVGLQPGQHDVRAYVLGAMPTDNKYMHSVFLEYIHEGVTQDIVYRGVAYLGIEILATEDLNGRLPTVEVVATKSDYDTGRASSNPAWSAYYRLIRSGIDTSKIDITSFTEWATFCDTESLTVALYLDAQMDLQAVLSHLGTAGRGIVINKANLWSVLIDKPTDVTQTFGIDNIVENSFSGAYLPSNEMANTVTCWYFDENNSYRKTAVEVRAPETTASTLKRATITLYGVTNSAQAKSYAVFTLNHTRLLTRTVSWKAEVEAINCEVGDVVYLQHDVPEWGFAPGRVMSADTTTVTCDLPIDFSDSENSGRSFRICIRHATPKTGENVDFIEVKNIVNPYLLGTPSNETVTVYTLDTSVTWQRTPVAGDMVTIGWLTGTEASTGDELLSLKQFRIMKIQRSQGQQFTLTATEYYDDAYEDNYIVTVPAIESGLSPITQPVVRSAWRVIGGIEESYISLSWLGNAALYYVYYKTAGPGVDGWSDWFFYGSTPLTFLEIKDFLVGDSYQFSISAENNPATGNIISVTHNVEDHSPIIAPVTNIICVQTGNSTFDNMDLDITWDAFPEFSFKTYRVEILSVTSVVLRSELAPYNRFSYSFEKNLQDNNNVPQSSVRVRVVVIDKNDNESASITQILTNNLPVSVTNLRTVTGSGNSFTGRDLDILWNASNEEDFKTYEVVITHGAGDLRTEYVTSPNYLYTRTMNEGDGLHNSIVAKVRVIDKFNQASGILTGTFSNSAPGNPSGLSGESWMNGVRYTWTANTENDFSHYEYRLRVATDAFEAWKQAAGTAVMRFLTEAETIAHGATASIIIEVKAVDTFGTESGTVTLSTFAGGLYVPPTSITDFNQISNAFPKIPVLIGDVWTNNSPVAGSVFWNSFSIWYEGTEHVIISGSTADHYIFWNNGATALSGSVDVPALPDDSFIIATNISGVHDLAWNGIANQVIGSAYIKSAAIQDLHVSNVSAGKLVANSIMTPGVYIGSAQYGTTGGGPTIDSLQPAEGGATVGATWGSNLGSIPLKLADAPSANGLYITATHLGYYNTGAWQSYIQNNGLFAFSGNAGNFIQWDGSNLTISGSISVTNPATVRSTLNVADGSTNDAAWRHASDTTKIDGGDIYASSITLNSINGASGTLTLTSGKILVSTTTGLEISGTGGMNVLGGGDITVNTTATGNYGSLIFKTDGQTQYSEMYRYYNDLFIRSSSATMGFYIGKSKTGTTGEFSSVYVTARNSAVLEAIYGGDECQVVASAMSIGGAASLICSTSTVSEAVSFIFNGSTYNHFFPYDTHKVIGLGRSGNAWKGIYYETLYAQCLHLDTLDDLKILHDMGPSGRAYASTDLPELSINSLPKWMTNYDELRDEIRMECGDMIDDEYFDELLLEEDGLGWRHYRNVGHFVDLVAGAVRQLDRKFEDLKVLTNKLNNKKIK